MSPVKSTTKERKPFDDAMHANMARQSRFESGEQWVVPRQYMARREWILVASLGVLALVGVSSLVMISDDRSSLADVRRGVEYGFDAAQNAQVRAARVEGQVDAMQHEVDALIAHEFAARRRR